MSEALHGVALPPGYRVCQLVLRTATHVVYRARRVEDDRPVLLKTLLREFPSAADLASLRRERELMHLLAVDSGATRSALEKSSHGLVLVLDDGGGEPLRNWIGIGSREPATFLELAIGVTETLGALHDSGITHCNVGPDSFLVEPETLRVQLIDLSLARQPAQDGNGESQSPPTEGSLVYMAPEQTGRVNRALDHRTDLYSLGVVLYELLTGKAPFLSTDPLELVHSHIARALTPPCEVDPAIPLPISNIVVKLLAKTAEGRYQSAHGLKADLQACLSQWRSTGAIVALDLGRHDARGSLQPTRRLYSREPEIAQLLAACERARQGGCELLLVSGFSGVGKSALVNEVRGPVTREGGLFITGKFDQLKRNVPYSSIAQAFQQLIEHLLTQSEDEVTVWRTRLLEALGPNGQVIVEVIPEVGLIIGAQPALPKLPPMESQNRFNLVFERFIRVFTQARFLLVLFLDDLQWADLATLKLLETVVSQRAIQHLLVIGAFRDNEVGAGHPLLETIALIEARPGAVSRIAVLPLPLEELNCLIADAMNCEPGDVESLARLVQQKTDGNPLFVIQFLKSLHQDQLVRFDHASGGWRFDVERIEQTSMTDNVVTLMAGRIQRLPQAAREALMLAACVGNEFALRTLALVRQALVRETAQDLWPALHAGLILPLGRHQEPLQEDVARAETPEEHYRFLHDRVQQAAYALIPDERKRELHLQVGRLMWQHLSLSDREDKLFDIVNHLCYGSELIEAADERLRIAEMACAAGRKAKTSAAFPAALAYFTAARALLPAAPWSHDYAIAFPLHLELAECQYLCGQFGEAQDSFGLLLQQAHSRLDRASVHDLQVLQYESLSRYEEAIDTGREGLALFGVIFPDTPDQRREALAREVTAIETLIGERNIEALIDLPPMRAPEQRSVLKLLANLHTPCYLSGDKTLTLLNTATMVRLCLEHGNMEESAYAYVLYAAMYLGPVRDDFEAAYAFGKLAIRVNERFEHRALRARVLMMFAWAISLWRMPLQESIPITREAFRLGNETGLFVDAAYALFNEIWFALLSGADLDKFCATYPAKVDYMNRVKMHHFAGGQQVILQWGRALNGLTVGPTTFTDDSFDEGRYLQTYRGHSLFEMFYFVAKLAVLYTFGDYPAACAAACEARRVIRDFPGTIWDELTVFYHALSLTACYRSLPEAERKAADATLENCALRLQHWAENSPHLFRAQHLIVSAELARIHDDVTGALRLYESAIEFAAGQECPREAGLASELYARFWEDRAQDRIASVFIAQARQHYRQWGAWAKVRQLEQRDARGHSQPFEDQPRYAVGAHFPDASSPSASGQSSVLDIAAVLKAAQAISREIVLEKLLQSLMKTVLESAGAARGALVLEKNGQWVIEAEGAANEDGARVLQSIPVESSDRLSGGIVNYVRRTCQAVVIDDAEHDERFARDPYVVSRRAKSILCVPILNQGKLTAILFLENDLTAGAFTPKRLEVIQILSSTIAVSIENARLYVEMEQEVAERKRAEQQVREQAMLLDKAGDAIFVCDLEDRITYWNKGAERLYGWPAHEALGRPLPDVVIIDGGSDRNEEATRSVVQRGEWTGEMNQRTRGGEEIIVQSRWTLVRSATGQPASVLMINTDITEKKRMEEHFLRAQRMESIGTLAGGIAHDLNNILTPIILAADTLQGNRHAQMNPQLLNMIRVNARRGAEVASQVLAFARGVEGKRLTLDPRHLLEEIGQIARQTFPRAIEIQTDSPASIWPVAGDPTQLHQVLLNLALNGRDAMPHGGTLRFSAQNVSVDEHYARLYPDAVPGRYVLLSVSDTGAGIAPQLIGRVFEPFFTTKEIGKGTGLGLSIVAGIVRSHGGFVNVWSEPGRGSRFEIHLPALASGEVSDAEPRSELPAGHGEHVLVVDDEVSVLEVTRTTLEAHGYRVTTAQDGTEALAEYARLGNVMDIVLTDWMMPYMDGAATIRALQKLNPEVRVVVVSGLHASGNAPEFSGLPVAGFLPKPYTAQKLLTTLHEVLQQH
jgi:PAS domain S-box-containing protein